MGRRRMVNLSSKEYFFNLYFKMEIHLRLEVYFFEKPTKILSHLFYCHKEIEAHLV